MEKERNYKSKMHYQSTDSVATEYLVCYFVI